MSTPASVLDAQSQRLLQLVEDYREQRCRALVDRAEQQSRELLNQARHDALERAREAIAAGVDRGAVEALTEVFEEVRYGAAPVTDRRRRRAREARTTICSQLPDGGYTRLSDGG